MQIITNM